VVARYGWSVEQCLDLTPRQLGWWAQQVERERLEWLRDMVVAFHHAKPKEFVEDLMEALEPKRVKVDPADNAEAMAQVAAMLGDPRSARRIRIRTATMKFLESQRPASG